MIICSRSFFEKPGGSEKTNALLKLISQQDDIDKISLYAKDLSKSKYEFLIKNSVGCCNKPFQWLSAQILWMMFMETLMVTTQAEKEKL